MLIFWEVVVSMYIHMGRKFCFEKCGKFFRGNRVLGN